MENEQETPKVDELVGANGVEDAVTVPPSDEADKLDELVAFMRKSTGYMVTITVLNNGSLTHNLITEKFPDLDILKSLVNVEKLAVERLKNL
jgi:hypothetical protein